MRNFKITVQYDGTKYNGWQKQGNTKNTIQERFENVLSRMCGKDVEIFASGRTDAGVHAKGQVANFHCQTNMTCQEIKDYLRQYLPEDIGVISVEEVDPRFHSRFNAVEKTYCYRVWNSDHPCVFERRHVWQVQGNLDVDSMNKAAQLFLGSHDFIAFCSNKHFKKSSVRTIHRFTVERLGDEILFTVTGDGFLYNMVRIMVGTLLAIGRGECKMEDIVAIFESRLREQAGETVPASGLCLMEVSYP